MFSGVEGISIMEKGSGVQDIKEPSWLYEWCWLYSVDFDDYDSPVGVKS